MYVHIEDNWRARTLDIWLTDCAGKMHGHYSINGNELEVEWTERRESEVWSEEPTLRLPKEVAEDIIRAMEGHVHAQDATSRHLDDAIAVRDRLLSIVERP